jgi:hypothetical protein
MSNKIWRFITPSCFESLGILSIIVVFAKGDGRVLFEYVRHILFDIEASPCYLLIRLSIG